MGSQDTKVKLVDIQVNYKEAVEAMGKYRNTITEAQEELVRLKKELKEGKISQQEYGKSTESAKVLIRQQSDMINTLNRQVQNEIKTQNAEQGSLKQLRAELSNATASYDAMSRAEREGAKGQELKNHILQITEELKGAEESTMRFYRNVGNYPTSVTNAIGGISDKFKELGSTITGLVTGGSMLAFSQKVIQVGRDFNDGMAKVRAVTQGTAEEMAMMTEEAKRLGATTAYTASEAAGALENLTRNGLTATEATNALAPVLQFAQANAIGLAEAADIMTNVSNGFNLGVEGMARTSDSLSWTASHSATNVSQMAEALKNAAPFGASLGQSIEEVNAALGVLADVGIKGSNAGSALRMVMLGLATETPKQQKVFEKYGITINQQTLKSEGLTKTLERLRDSGIMESARSASELADVFGRRVSPQSMTLLNNIEALQEKLAGLGGEAGTTQAMFDVSLSEVTKSLKGLESAWEAFLLTLYDSNSDAMVAPLEALRGLVNWLREHMSDVGQVIMSVIAGITFSKLISSAMAAFTEIKTSAVANAQAATQQVQVCQNNEIAIRREAATITSQIENSSAMERERLEVQLVAKKRELAEAEKATQKAKTAEITLWERAAALETGTGWQQAFTMAKIGVTSFVTTAKVAFKGFILTAVISLAFELLMKLYDAIKSGKGIFGSFGKWASDVWNEIVKGIVNVINYFIELYNESFIVRAAVQAIMLQFKQLWEVVKFVFNLIIDAVKSVGRNLSGLGLIIKGIFTLNWGDIKEGFSKMIGNLGETWNEIANDAKTMGKNLVDNYVGSINETIKGKKVEPIKIPTETEAPKKVVSKKVTTSKTNLVKPTVTDEEDEETSTGTSDSKGDKKTSKADNARARAAQEEAKLVAEAEKAMLELLGESIEKKRAMLEAQYRGEINKLKAKLETDKTLTEKSRDAINQLIYAKEQKLQQELYKLRNEETKKLIGQEQKLLESRLSVVRKNSDEEYKIKLEQSKKKIALDLITLTEEEKIAKDGAMDALRISQKALEELEKSGDATESALNTAREQVEAAQNDLLRITENYIERRANLNEKGWLQEVELRRQRSQQILDEQMQMLQNEITALETANEEMLNKKIEGNEEQGTIEQMMNEMNLDVFTENELRKLEILQEMAQQRLEFIMSQGQMENETEAQFNARVLAGKQELAKAQAQLNQAQLKNEQAYAKSMKNVGDSLISVLEAVGESDENFAKLSKIVTLFKIAVDTGKAISSGIASAMELPYPANLAAVATTVATVLANIATAVSTVKSANFAKGGKVNGPGTGTSDSIPANLSNGEFVMTAKATKLFEPILTVMNAIGARVPIISGRKTFEMADTMESLGDSFTRAAQEIRPVVSVVEITEAQERVSLIEKLDNY